MGKSSLLRDTVKEGLLVLFSTWFWGQKPPTLCILSSQVSISSTFYERLFRTKVFWAAFLYLKLRFIIFWRKEISAKAARKMLVKLTTGTFMHSSANRNVKVARHSSNNKHVTFIQKKLLAICCWHWLRCSYFNVVSCTECSLFKFIFFDSY